MASIDNYTVGKGLVSFKKTGAAGLGDPRHHRHHHRPRHAGAGLGHTQQEGGLSMSWQEGAAVTVVLLGLGAGAFLVAQRPSFWIEFGARVAKALLPLAWRYVSRRMLPEEEAAWREAERRGQGDEWLRGRRLRMREKP